ncbi:hypothetical protein Dsin_013991 [Dipteronia sinensis]|uniref:DNA-directed RNA polymerase III subunit n=1 Tax=Dipteronia sinensis TaxID=43782 RepID=A0AAE0AL35_9ROSI|nr:hypothetical protein Dsin_013991 [Dipteronia sinensis]
MSFRGRGRGRGGFGGGRGFAAEKPFELFPVSDVVLPAPTTVPIDRNLILWNTRLLNYWKTSPYYLEENVEKKNQSTDIERYCDLKKPKTASTRDSIYQFLQINASNFPQELVKDSRQQQKRKRVRWNPGMKKIDDYFDEIEQKYQDQGEKDDTEKKEDEDEEDNDDEAVEEDEEEFSDDGDYNKNEEFDDDEDDFNMNDDDNDEPMY